MKAQRATHRVGKMARLLKVSRGGFYAWLDRAESHASLRNRDLVTEIRGVQKKSKYRYGSPRVTQELRRGGRRVGHNRVARLMRQNGLGARPRRQFRVTTRSVASRAVAANLVDRNFWPPAANQIWASDLTYIATGEGWLYLAVVLDLYSRRVVGWSMGTRLTYRSCAASVLDGGAEAQARRGADLPLRPWFPIHQRRLQQRCEKLRLPPKHES
jgi:transposase InsO family protein